MWAAKVQASLRIRAVSPEPSLLAHTSSESRGTLRQKARSLAPLNGWPCAVTICHDGMLEDTISLDAAHLLFRFLTLWDKITFRLAFFAQRKSCSFVLPRAFRNLLSIYLFSYLPFSFEGRMWDLIVSVPDLCLSFYVLPSLLICVLLYRRCFFFLKVIKHDLPLVWHWCEGEHQYNTVFSGAFLRSGRLELQTHVITSGVKSDYEV